MSNMSLEEIAAFCDGFEDLSLEELLEDCDNFNKLVSQTENDGFTGPAACYRELRNTIFTYIIGRFGPNYHNGRNG